MKTEVDISEEEMWKYFIKFINKCKSEDLIKILHAINNEFNSRIAHIEEGWNKYWKE